MCHLQREQLIILRGSLADKGDIHIMDRNEQLVYAAKDGDTLKVSAALTAGAGVNAKDDRGNTALLLASRYGDEQMVRLLLEEGADPRILNDILQLYN